MPILVSQEIESDLWKTTYPLGVLGDTPYLAAYLKRQWVPTAHASTYVQASFSLRTNTTPRSLRWFTAVSASWLIPRKSTASERVE